MADPVSIAMVSAAALSAGNSLYGGHKAAKEQKRAESRQATALAGVTADAEKERRAALITAREQAILSASTRRQRSNGQGRAGTLLTGGQGISSAAPGERKTLLGT